MCVYVYVCVVFWQRARVKREGCSQDREDVQHVQPAELQTPAAQESRHQDKYERASYPDDTKLKCYRIENLIWETSQHYDVVIKITSVKLLTKTAQI